jgi:hypothetical protein
MEKSWRRTETQPSLHSDFLMGLLPSGAQLFVHLTMAAEEPSPWPSPAKASLK